MPGNDPRSNGAFASPHVLRAALQALSDLLESDGLSAELVVVGGASLNLLGLIERSTSDVDVIAVAERRSDGAIALVNPEPLSATLEAAIAKVARDLRLPANWMNTEVARQWISGLPPNLEADLTWETFGALQVGLAGRKTLITLKLFAASDSGIRSVHMQDLIALHPTLAELQAAANWVVTQDAAAEFPSLVAGAIRYVSQQP